MNIAVAQSGGPTCAINASLAGVYDYAHKSGKVNKIYGALNGIEGIIKQNLVDLSDYIKTDSDLNLLVHTPSTALGSCRYKLKENDITIYQKILDCFEKYDIKIFFYIGGNDSMDTVMKLSKYFKENLIDIKVIGIPKTIDNDLCGTDHSPGFGSAAKYVNTSIQEVAGDSRVYSVKSVTIVEIMGRHAGWLTASSCCLRANGETAPHLIYLPETEFDQNKFIEDVKRVQKEHHAVIVAVSEGVKLKQSADYRSNKTDAFGHEYLSGIGKYLEQLISNEVNCKVRSIELNVMQRCSAHIASDIDLKESKYIGECAVETALDGETGVMMAYKRKATDLYEIEIVKVPIENVANQEQFFPMKWINAEHNNVLDDAIDYFLPLIQGEPNIKMKNGMPLHFKI